MTYAEVMASIKKGALKQVYLISGEEAYLADKIERALLEKLLPEGNRDEVNVLNGDISLEELLELIETVPFFTERNIIILRNTTLFKEKKKASGQEKTVKNNKPEERFIALVSGMPDYTVLIIQSSEKADKRRKLYKAIAQYGITAEVAQIRPWEVKDWLNRKLKEIGRQFERPAYEYFLEATSLMSQISLCFLDQELDKLALYTDKEQISKQDLLAVLASIPEVSIFAMLDALGDKNVEKALRLLTEQLNAGEHPLKFITMLSRHTRQLWHAKLCVSRGESTRQIAEKLGLVPFIAEKLMVKSRNFSEETLNKASLQFAEADYKLKSGQADCALLERILIELCA